MDTEDTRGVGSVLVTTHDDDTSVISGTSSPDAIDAGDKNDENEAPTSFHSLHSPVVPKQIALPKQWPKRSWVWKHFKPIMSKKEYAFCILCSEDVFYGPSRSMDMLECHIQEKACIGIP
jgi:hypothetical protein